MVKDLFERIQKNKGPLGKWASQAEGYYVFPKLEGELGPRMQFQGKDILNWSLNDYLGLANHPEVRKADTDAAIEYFTEPSIEMSKKNQFQTIAEFQNFLMSEDRITSDNAAVKFYLNNDSIIHPGLNFKYFADKVV
jgi:hypothetical protein